MATVPTLPAGYELQGYVIDSVLGKGGFGITYRAKDKSGRREVAIKEFFPPEFMVRHADLSVTSIGEHQDDTVKWGLERFVTEANTLRLFNHPNIVKVHSIIRANKTAYMVMDFERGETLRELLKQGKQLDEEALRNMMLPLLDALQMMHNQGFIHRDIKPANILIRNDDSPVLIDFGSARFAQESETRTLTQLISPGYAPNEQYYGKSDVQGPWSDIYSLGATVYRAITGKAPAGAGPMIPPADGDSGALVRDELEKQSDNYSIFFLRVIEQTLNDNHRERPQTAQALKELLLDPSAAFRAQRRHTRDAEQQSEEAPPDKTWWPWAAGAVLLAGVLAAAFFLLR